jgi:hypothetical protein
MKVLILMPLYTSENIFSDEEHRAYMLLFEDNI